MEEESFEDEEIAALHERALRLHQGRPRGAPRRRRRLHERGAGADRQSGGWPMSVWLTPEREPFFGGTYFPPRDGARGARQGFLDAAARQSATTYARIRTRVGAATAAPLVGALCARSMDAQPAPPAARRGAGAGAHRRDRRRLQALVRRPRTAGCGARRSFRRTSPVRLLLREHRRTGDAEALRMATLTLEKMAAGGMYDQLGGGFHRYSTDAPGWCRTSRRCSTTTRCWRSPTLEALSGHRARRLRARRARDARLPARAR